MTTKRLAFFFFFFTLISISLLPVNSFSDEKELPEKSKRKIDQLVQIILTNPLNPEIYAMVERTDENPKLVSSYLEQHFDEKIKKETGNAGVQLHLIRLRFRFRNNLEKNVSTLMEELEKIKEGVYRLKEKSFQKLFYKMYICCLEELPERPNQREELASRYLTEVLPSWKEYREDGEETLFKAIFFFYFSDNDTNARRLAAETFDEWLNQLDPVQLPLLHLSIIHNIEAPFPQKRSMLMALEKKTQDVSFNLKTRWQRLKWETDALRKEEMFTTGAEWKKAAQASFDEYLDILEKGIRSSHSLRPEMEIAILSYLALGVEWDGARQKSYFEETDWTGRENETIRLLIPLASEQIDETILSHIPKTVLEKFIGNTAVPGIARARLLLSMKIANQKLDHLLRFHPNVFHYNQMKILLEYSEDLRVKTFEESLERCSFSLREFRILNRISFDRHDYFKINLSNRYLEVLRNSSFGRNFLHEESTPLLSYFLIDPLLNNDRFQWLLEMISKTRLTPAERMGLFLKSLGDPSLPSKKAIEIAAELLNEKKYELSMEDVKGIFTKYPALLEGDVVAQSLEMIDRKNLTLDRQIEFFSKLLENKGLKTEAVILIIRKLGKTKSGLAIEAIKGFLSNHPIEIIEAAIQALAKIGKDSIPALIDALEEYSCLGDQEIARALIQMGEAAIDPLIEAFMNAPVTEENGCLDSATNETRIAILRILKEISSLRVKDFLITISSSPSSDDVYDLPFYALEALVQIDRGLALTLMVQQVESPLHSPSHKIALVHLLLEINPENTVEYLAKHLREGEPHLCITIIDALIGSNYNRATALLLPCLDSKESDVRLRALDALKIIGDTTALPKFIECLSDSDPHFREQLISGLVEFGGKALPYLIEAIASDNRLVWGGAHETLLGMPSTILPELVKAAESSNNKTIKERLESIIRKFNNDDERHERPFH